MPPGPNGVRPATGAVSDTAGLGSALVSLGNATAYLRGIPGPGTAMGKVAAGNSPLGIAYDSANGDLYVANQGSANVSVISGSTNTVVATIPVDWGPYGVAYDSANGLVYVATCGNNCNLGPGNVTVINGSTNRVVGTIPVGTTPSGIAFDSANGNLYVTNQVSDTVSVVSPAANAVVATVRVGGTPIGVACDPADGDVYVANSGSSNVSVLSGVTNRVVANISFPRSPVGGMDLTENPMGVAVDPASGNVYVALQWSNNTGINAVGVISAGTDTLVTRVPVQLYPVGVAVDTANGYVYVAGGFGILNVVSATNNTPVTTLTANLAYTSSPMYVAYDPANANLYLTDYGTNQVLVVSTLSSTSVPTAATLDAGQALLLRAPIVAPARGTSQVLVAVSPGTGLVCRTDAPGFDEVSWACEGMTPGTYNVTVTAVDTLGNRVSTAVAVTVFSAPAVSLAGPATRSIDVGQSTTFSAVARGGSGGYAYAWRGLPPGCASADAATITCPPLVPGTSAIRAAVTDSDGFSAVSGSVTLTVYAPPSVRLEVTPSTILQGASVTFRAVTAGGAGTLAHAWTGLPAGCAGAAGPTVACSPSAAGTFNVTVIVTDANNVTARGGATLVVNPSFLGLPAAEGYFAVGAPVGIVVALVAAILMLRRRSRRKEPPG